MTQESHVEPSHSKDAEPAAQPHTPLHWVARPAPNNDSEWEVIQPDPSQTWNDPHDRCWYVATVMDCVDGAPAEDTARLIAAAPELLEAARDWINYLADDEPGDGATESRLLDAFRAAIAKATGARP